MIVVNEKRCTGCARCVVFCPFEALRAWGIAVVNEECTDCLACIDYCPNNAISDNENKER